MASIVKIDSIPLQFDIADSCNCCQCRWCPETKVYINHEGEIERFKRSKSKDPIVDVKKSKLRITSQVSQFLEQHFNHCLDEMHTIILDPIKRASVITLEHMREVNRRIQTLWKTNTPPSSPNT